MEEMNLIIATGVPQQVEIVSTGIPMHETEVEFCVIGDGVSFNFPAKMVDDKVFVFMLTDSLLDYVDNTLDYKLFVYYGNARFEADKGRFNLVDKKSFDTGIKDQKTGEVIKRNKVADSLSEKLYNKATKRPAPEKENPKETPKVTPKKEEPPEETKVVATKPKPTPEPTPTVTLKEAKEAIKNSGVTTIKEKSSNDDYNKKIKEILTSISKTATPTSEMQREDHVPETTPEATPEKAKFFEEVNKLREINEKRRKNKQVKDIIQSSKKKK